MSWLCNAELLPHPFRGTLVVMDTMDPQEDKEIK